MDFSKKKKNGRKVDMTLIYHTLRMVIVFMTDRFFKYHILV